MYGIFVNNDTDVLRAASASDREMFVGRGWRELTPDEITAAGMEGYEHIVSPLNTTADADGIITFKPPAPPSETELYESLRLEAERLLAATDQYGMDDYPDNELRAAYRAYRADLRGINRQPGAPWDGGGPATPWPAPPEV